MKGFDKFVDIGVNVRSRASGLKRVKKKIDELSRSFGKTAVSGEAAESSIDDVNRSVLKLGSSAVGTSGSLGALETQMMATRGTSALLGDDFDDLTDNIERSEEFFQAFLNTLDGGIEDASLEEIDEALSATLEGGFERGWLDIDEVAEELGVDISELTPEDVGIDPDALTGFSPDEAEGFLETAEAAEELLDVLHQHGETEVPAWSGGPAAGGVEFLELLETQRKALEGEIGDIDALTDEELGRSLTTAFDETYEWLDTRVDEDIFEKDEWGDLVASDFAHSLLRKDEGEDDIIPDQAFRTWRELLGVDTEEGPRRDVLRQIFSGDFSFPTSGEDYTLGDPEDELAARMGVPVEEIYEKGVMDPEAQRKYSQRMKHLRGDDSERVTRQMMQAIPGSDALTEKDLTPRRTEVADALGEMGILGPGRHMAQEATILDAFEEMGEPIAADKPDAGRIPYSAEALRAMLGSKFATTDSPALQQQIMSVFDKLRKGDVDIRSIAESDPFKGEFSEMLTRRLRNADVPDDAVRHIVPQITGSISEQMAMNDDLVFISDLFEDPQAVDDLYNEAFQSFQAMELDLPGDDEARAMDEVAQAFDEVIEATDVSARETDFLFQARAAPRERLALGKDEQFFEAYDTEKSRHTNLKKLLKQRRKIRSELEDTMSFGRGPDSRFEGVIPTVFKGSDRMLHKANRVLSRLTPLNEETNLLGNNAIEATESFEAWQKRLRKMTPSLDAVSMNVMGMNFAVNRLLTFIYGIIALMGPLITMVLGFASAMAVGATALAAFTAVGAIGFLDELEKSMAGVNDKAEAMEELMKALKHHAKEAVEPLANAQVGGDGAGGIETFVNVLRGSLQLLHNFSRAMARIVELDEFASFVENVGHALFSSDDEGPSMIEAMAEASERVFPILEEMFVFLFDNFPEFTIWVAEVTEKLSEGLGPALKTLLPTIKLAIEFGAAFISQLARMVGWLAKLGGILSRALSWLGDTGEGLSWLAKTAGWALAWVVGLSYALGALASIALADTTVALYRAAAAVYAKAAALQYSTIQTKAAIAYVVTHEVVTWLYNAAVSKSIVLQYAEAVAIATRNMALSSGIPLLSTSTALTTALGVASGTATTAVLGLAAAFHALKVAIYSIPIIGWILLAISAIGALIAYFYDLEDVVWTVSVVWNAVVDSIVWGIEKIKGGLDWIISKLQKIGEYWETFKGLFRFGYQGNIQPAANVRGGQRSSTVNNYNVQVEGGDKRTGKHVRRELDKRERRNKRYNGTQSYGY